MTTLSLDGSTLITVSVILFVWASISGIQFRCSAAHAAETKALATSRKEATLAVDLVRKNGDHIAFPYHQLYFEPLPPKAIEIARNHEVAVLKKLLVVAPTILDRAPTISYTVRWLKLGLDLKRMRKTLSRERRRHGIDAKMNPGYKSQFRKLLAQLMKDSQTYAKKLKETRTPKDYTQLTQKATRIVEILIDVYGVSPVAGFIDWGGGLVNNVPFTDFILDLLAHLRHHGYDTPMNLIMNSLTCDEDTKAAEQGERISADLASGGQSCMMD